MSLPPSEIPLGAIRFNSDSQKLEYWNGSAWFQIKTFSPVLSGGVRGVFMTGYGPADTNTIDYINIATGGTATACAELLTENFNVKNEDILILCIIDLTNLGGSELIREKGYLIKTIVDY